MGRFPVLRDAVERVLATFVVSLLGLATADGVGWVDWANVSNWRVWGISGLVAAFTVLKTAIATRIAKRNGQATSASFDPAVQLQPTGGVAPGAAGSSVL